ncbi:hypothetical protein EDB92DRAFT_1472362 [Lactarius akahatsu]|uniref:Uncharacterized protein n=1 Tax=Lactarius akahatsu TaxID=416441 RepID=A0AAD4LCP8_9AGAM|nr:hypothetical protein EDB92DRAFT_1472362 [Lactarius akahatsu]
MPNVRMFKYLAKGEVGRFSPRECPLYRDGDRTPTPPHPRLEAARARRCPPPREYKASVVNSGICAVVSVCVTGGVPIQFRGSMEFPRLNSLPSEGNYVGYQIWWIFYQSLSLCYRSGPSKVKSARADVTALPASTYCFTYPYLRAIGAT